MAFTEEIENTLRTSFLLSPLHEAPNHVCFSTLAWSEDGRGPGPLSLATRPRLHSLARAFNIASQAKSPLRPLSGPGLAWPIHGLASGLRGLRPEARARTTLVRRLRPKSGDSKVNRLEPLFRVSSLKVFCCWLCDKISPFQSTMSHATRTSHACTLERVHLAVQSGRVSVRFPRLATCHLLSLSVFSLYKPKAPSSSDLQPEREPCLTIIASHLVNAEFDPLLSFALFLHPQFPSIPLSFVPILTNHHGRYHVSRHHYSLRLTPDQWRCHLLD
jgi:hypothetical protein